MILRAEIFPISLPRPFRIAHGVSTHRDTVLIHLLDESSGLAAHGEGALPPYYPSKAEACLNWIKGVNIGEILADDSLANQIAKIPQAPDNAVAAYCALEIAVHDLWAARQQKPLWQVWNLNPTRSPRCPVTLSIPQNVGELDAMISESGNCRFFKLKSGSGDPAWDEACARHIRERKPAADLCVDANTGWSVKQAANIVPRLARYGVSFIEQPVPTEGGSEPWRELRSMLAEKLTPPLIADESLRSENDLAALRGLADGVNIKLLKCGGLLAARRWITLARSAGYQILIGVMVETGIGRTAAAQLAPLVDWADIDPPSSIPAAPMIGFTLNNDRIVLSDRPGLGLQAAGS